MTYTVSQVTESIGTITLDHEPRRNALSHALVEEVIAALGSFQEAKVRVVILRAKPGAKVFSAGHDIDELPRAVAIRLAGMTRSANSCARSRTILGRSLPWLRVACGVGPPKRCLPAI